MESMMKSVLLHRERSKIKQKFVGFCSSSTRCFCCTCRLRNKGAILTLFLNYLIASVFYYLSVYSVHNTRHMLVCGLTMPFAGWLADIYIGRYRVIRWSIFIMWFAALLGAMSSVISNLVESYNTIQTYIIEIMPMVMSFGFGGFQANAVLFGIDQLYDASTDEIIVFIRLYVWTYFCGAIILYFTYTCLNVEYRLFEQLLVCICLTIALVSMFCEKKILVKEPVTRQNPFKLIYKVIQYAIKNKHPRSRSAFTYCEDELPSRIDLGKSKYGGPFTIEQVEDVKTFFRLLVLIVFSSALSWGILAAGSFWQHLLRKLTYTDVYNPRSLQECIYGVHSLCIMLFYGGAMLIPLYEFVLSPFLRKYLHWMNSYWKISLGAILQITKIVTLMAFDLKARHTFIKNNSDNATIQCIFTEPSGTLAFTLNIMWMSLPSFLDSLSIIMYAIGSFEFLCSQSPYSLRGLLFGAGFGCIILFNLVGYFVQQPFMLKRFQNHWGTRIISCGFWYLLLIVILLVLDTAIFCLLIKWYKKRKREDVLPNEQIFAERYYTK